MKLTARQQATNPIKDNVVTYPLFENGFGSYSQKQIVKSTYISNQIQSNNVGNVVLASLNFGELDSNLKLIKKVLPKDRFFGIKLGGGILQDAGGKTYDGEATKYRYKYKDKLSTAVEICSQQVATHGCKVQKNIFGCGWHGLAQSEFVKKAEVLLMPYKINFFGYPTDEKSEKNFPELLSYWIKQEGYQNVVYNNPKGDTRLDSAYALLSHVITDRQVYSYDRIDLTDFFYDLDESKSWMMTAYISCNPRFKSKFDLLGFWKKPQVDRQDRLLQNLILQARPHKEDICLIAGDFGYDAIDNLRSFANQQFKFKPRIRQLLCGILPEGMNAVFGILRPFKFTPIATPHFDELEYLIESDP